MSKHFYKTILLICLLLFLAAYFYNAQNNQDSDISNKISLHIERITYSNSISSYTKRAEGHLLLFLMLQDHSDREKFFKRVKKLKENIDGLEPLLLRTEMKSLSVELNNNLKMLTSFAEEIFTQYDNTESQKYHMFFKKNEKLIHDLHSVSSNIRKLGVKVVNFSALSLENYKQEINNKNSIKYRSLGIFTLVTFAFLIVISYQSGKIELSSKVVDSLEKLSYIDSLTSIGNRRCFDQQYIKEWQRASRSRKPLSLLFIDIDNFKNFNDEYGHANGDNCLVRVAQSLKHCLKRPTDVISRYGGEEFVIVLPETNNPHYIAENCRKTIEKLKIPNKGSSYDYVTISIGIGIILPTKESSAESFLQKVDKALYLAKNEGKNCIRDYVETSV